MGRIKAGRKGDRRAEDGKGREEGKKAWIE